MEKIRENLSYIVSEDDSDKVKFEKIYKKIQDNNIELNIEKIEIVQLTDNYAQGILDFDLQGKNKQYPFTCEILKLNSEIHNIIINCKKIIVFEALGILPTSSSTSSSGRDFGTATEKQKSFIRDKHESTECKEIIERKLKEFGISSINELNKQQASKIIDHLPKRT